MMALGVMVRRLPFCLMLAAPLTTCAPMGLACAPKLKQQVSATKRGVRRSLRLDLAMLPASQSLSASAAALRAHERDLPLGWSQLGHGHPSAQRLGPDDAEDMIEG